MSKNFKNKLIGVLLTLLIISSILPVGVFANTIEEVDLTAPVTKRIPYHKNNKPNRVVNTVNGDPSSERGFNWFTTDKFENSFVEVSKDDNFSNSVKFDASVKEVKPFFLTKLKDGNYKGHFYEYFYNENLGKITGHYEGEEIIWEEGISEAEKKESKGPYVGYETPVQHEYKAKATGLDPETKYFYRVVSGDEASHIGEFVTSSSESKPFSVIHYTDTQVAYYNQNYFDETWYAQDTLRAALEKSPESNLVVHTGDIVEFSDLEDEWYDFFEQSKDYLKKVTFAPVPGDHDEYSFVYGRYGDSVNFNRHFNVPVEGKQVGGSYYSYDYNNTHFTMINTNDYDEGTGGAMSQEQLQWIEEDVKAAKERGVDWTILAFHKPLFSTSYHSLHDSDMLKIRHQLMKLIDELDIDLVMWGHDHIISQTHGLKYDENSERLAAKVSDKPIEEDGLTIYENPEGTIFVLPNTAGTKVYVDRYDKGYDYLKGLRYRFNDLSEEDYNTYKSFFNEAYQPNERATNRNSTIQNFATYDFTKDTIVCKIWQVEGEKGSTRETKLVTEFVIDKNEKLTEDTVEKEIIPFETEYRYNENLNKDERNVIREGINGEKTITYNVVKKGSEIISKEKIKEEITREPVNAIVEIGTKETLQADENWDDYLVNNDSKSEIQTITTPVFVESKNNRTTETKEILETKENTTSEVKAKIVLKIDSKDYKIDVKGDSTTRELDAPAVISNDRTMIALRFFAESIGIEVDYDEATRTALFSKDGKTIKIQIDGDEIEMPNGEKIKMDSKVLIINNRILIPLTNVANVFGMTNGNTEDGVEHDIEWDNENREVIINVK